MNADLETLDPTDRVEIIIHRDKGGVRARVHAAYITGTELKSASDELGGRILLNAVARCASAINVGHSEPVEARRA